VLTKKKSAEEIMGSSFLQGQLVALLVTILMSKLDLSKYVVVTNETGFIYAPKNWRILDIAIFEKARVKKELFSKKYVKTAPKIVIEVDTKAELRASGDILSYVTEKTDDLLDAGVEKVIWILTESENVLIAEPGKQWIMARWSDTIPVIEDITLNLEELVQTLA
jgi:Uma2 family endonuclease